MRAVALTDFDSGPVLQDFPRPAPGMNEVLIRVHASSINGFDAAVAAGMLKGMIDHEFPVTLGRDFAGTVEEVGGQVTRFRPGEGVFGYVGVATVHDGTWAEYIVGAEDGSVVRKPEALNFLAAGTLPLAGAAALDAVDAVSPAEGDTVLMVGAAGGVGSFAVQLAAKRGARVVATARADDEARLRSLGAAETIDYTHWDLDGILRDRHPDGVDALIDLVTSADDFGDVAAHVRDGGRVASALGAADVEALAGRGVHAVNIRTDPDAEALNRLGELAAGDELEVSIDEAFPLERAPEALAKFASGKRGKIVISVAED
jgi:NADPH:quinone reductase-like Zn-dependent oxidoreductase